MKKPFIDLDALITVGAEFRFQGHDYKLKAVDAQTFIEFNNAWFEMQSAVEKDEIDEKQSMDISVNLIRSVCPELTEEKIRTEMTTAQIGAVVQLIVEAVTGNPTDHESIKKKVFKLRG